jgi:hypothetical protein
MPKGHPARNAPRELGDAQPFAMAAGLQRRFWDIGDIVKLIEEWETASVQTA